MASPTNKVVISVLDYAGKLAKVTFHILAAIKDPAHVDLVDLYTKLMAISNGQSLQQSLSETIAFSNAAASNSGSFSDDQDKAEFRMRDEANSPHVWFLPSPVSTVFSATDNTVVDTAATVVTDIVSAVQALAKSDGGLTIDRFTGGRRRRFKKGGRA